MPCLNGRWTRLATNSTDALLALNSKAPRLTFNSYYKGQNYDQSDMLYSETSGAWGYCDCRDLSNSGRIVAAGLTCEMDPTDEGCKSLMKSKNARLIGKTQAIPIARPDFNKQISAKTSFVCGCDPGYGWTKNSWECTKGVRPCKAPPLRQSSHGLRRSDAIQRLRRIHRLLL